MTISSTVRVFPGCEIGPNFAPGEFVIIGQPPTGCAEGEIPTVIGMNATIRSHSVIYAGNIIGTHLQTGHGTLIREYNRIGDHVSIGSHSIIEHHVEIGNRVRVHSNAFVPEYTILEEESWLGPNVCLTNAPHPLCPNFPKCRAPVVLRRNAKVGANATLVPGVTIGEMSLVAAGSVVVKDVPPGVVVAGNPAVIIKNADEIICSFDGETRPYKP